MHRPKRYEYNNEDNCPNNVSDRNNNKKSDNSAEISDISNYTSECKLFVADVRGAYFFVWTFKIVVDA